MLGFLTRAARRSQFLEILGALVVVPVIHRLGIGGTAPVWLGTATIITSMALQPRAVQLWLSGGDLSKRLNLRIGLHLGLMTTLPIYLFGWGPLITVSYLISASLHIRWSGSQAWKPAVIWTVVGVAIGQLGVWLGLIFTYASATTAQLAGIGGGLVAAALIRQYGLSAQVREKATQEREEAIQERERMVTETARLNHRFRALVQNSSDIIVVVDPGGLISYLSPAMESQLGYQPEALIGTDGSILMSPSGFADAQEQLSALLEYPGKQMRTQFRLIHADGTFRWYDSVLLNLLDDPDMNAIVVNQRDITQERLVKDQLIYDASHDLLTGLNNRRSFLETFDRLLSGSSASGRRLALLFIDLDDFKQVNDTLGHDVGDAVLARVAASLRASVLGADVIGRLGGDEFVAVLRNIDSSEHAVVVTRRILEELGIPQRIGEHQMRIAASVGIAISDHEGTSSTTLLHRADLAMYEAKRRGVGQWIVYTPQLEIPGNAISRQKLLDAIEDGQLRLQYQPVVDLKTLAVVGVEALVRWQHPERGLIPPLEFITAAEENGAIGPLGEWVASAACRSRADWQRLLAPEQQLFMSINVSPRQLLTPEFSTRLDEIFRSTGIAAENVVLEVTESVLVDSPIAHQTLTALAELGTRIAIDDFGTGYSSLQYLNRLPIHTLKLDRSFVTGLDGSPEGSAIASVVARLADTLHLTTVAEGIETPDQAAELSAMGYQLAQGYLFARPMEGCDVEELLRSGGKLSAPDPQAKAQPRGGYAASSRS